MTKSGLVLTLLVCSFMTIQAQENTVVVTLNVNTGQIEKNNLATTCNFGQPQNISNENFTIEVNVGDIITWQGVSSSAPETDIVEITKIKRAKGKNIFDKEELLPGENKKISGKALFQTTAEDIYKYDISFTVSTNGKKRNGTFHIDPKIIVH
jgi:hypothetical protein